MNKSDLDGRNITVVVNGRFHAFDYAADLYRRGRLLRLISTMPALTARRYCIGKEAYVGLPIFEVLKRTWRKCFKRELPVCWYAKLFTKVALKFVPAETRVIISFAGYSEEIFNDPKLRSALKILDRGSTHCLENDTLNRLAAEYHGFTWKSHPEDFVKRELREYESADRILVPSNFVLKSFVRNGVPENKVWKIPYGVSNHRFSADFNRDVKRKDVVLFVGYVSARKGIAVLVQTIKLVRDRFPNIELWLVGDRDRRLPEALFNYSWIKCWGILRGPALSDCLSKGQSFLSSVVRRGPGVGSDGSVAMRVADCCDS